MSQFEITAVSEKERPFDSKYGPKIGYRVHLRNEDGTDHLNVEYVRNASSPKPALGEQLEGDLEDRGEYGERIRIANRGGAGGVWSGTRAEDPKRSAHIARMHAQEMGLRLFEIQVQRGLIEESANARDILLAMIDWFTADAQKARDAA